MFTVLRPDGPPTPRDQAFVEAGRAPLGHHPLPTLTKTAALDRAPMARTTMPRAVSAPHGVRPRGFVDFQCQVLRNGRSRSLARPATSWGRRVIGGGHLDRC
ncbi:hypothetical protein ADL29_17125 [Streptomyces chattanoogensis]|uniref:Uncharacterized protein n=1 Tax=Streptomyces chattanoogensis TaxID=66876 RepID=A0A0N0XV38_9ACTN|nr:hypothetical protein ADL29_17125 [Streptomyces chattanoogensis]